MVFVSHFPICKHGGWYVSLAEFITKEGNYLDGIINKYEFVNLDFLNDIDANNELLITFHHTKIIKPLTLSYHKKYF